MYWVFLSQGNNTGKYYYFHPIFIQAFDVQSCFSKNNNLFICFFEKHLLYLYMTKEILQQMLDDGLNTQQMAERLNCTRRTISNAINRNNLESPRNKSIRLNVKHCAGCNKTLDRSLFYTKSNKNSSLCKSCIVTNNKTNRQTVKQQCITYLGGCCSKCGYNKCNAALEFHHLDPNEKDKDYSYLKTSFTDALKSELDKCVLLCANCHREEHHSSTTDI